MVNSGKTPTGKAKKGQIAVRVDSGSIKACFPRSYCNKGQIKVATGISLVNGWETKASQLQRRLQLELEEGKLDDGKGNFNLGRYQEILKEYGLQAKLRLVKGDTKDDDQLPPKPELSLMEVWDMYCEYRKHGLRESTYQNTYQGQYKSFLESAIEDTNSDDAIKIRNWLVENRNHNTVKQVLSNLSKAYQRAIKDKLLTHNPFDGMAEEIVNKGARGKTQDEVEIENDEDVLDRGKAYTWDEAQAILEYVQEKYLHWHDYLKFKFLTGCRTGEAIALKWCDIAWDKERILIRRTYDRRTKKFYPLKNDRTYKGDSLRRFPMPKDGELWKLLKSIPCGELNDIVFQSKTGKTIDTIIFATSWRGRDKGNSDKGRKGIIPALIEQGKLTKYLSPYNTRHTFITHAIFDLGIDEKKVSYWCGHKIEVSNKHYQDVAIFADRTNPEISMTQQSQQQSKIDLLEQKLAEQQELIDKLMQGKE
ncbi:tyrosine-type recombinase/integrase [Nostoc sp.]|uniref:tyrosine-type recombinase/integrase n=1 Tax=Nostoc sp. TaxID=1180 RepID=UPI002FF97FDC